MGSAGSGQQLRAGGVFAVAAVGIYLGLIDAHVASRIDHGPRLVATQGVGDGVRIGFASELKNALIGDGACIGPQCFIADSRVDARAYLGALVRTSNHRLDGATVTVHIGDTVIDSQRDKLGAWIGEGAALGVGVIILPGRIVAPGSQFGPRITVERNLPPGRYRLLQSLHSQPLE